MVLLWPRVSRAQIQYLSLDRQTLTVPNRSFYIEQVLDGRTDRAGIGRLPPQKGFGGAARPTDLAPSLLVALTGFLQAQLPGRATDKPALLLVRDLHLAEVQYGTGTGVQTNRLASATLACTCTPPMATISCKRPRIPCGLPPCYPLRIRTSATWPKRWKTA